MIYRLVDRMKGKQPSPPRSSLSKMGWSWLGAFLGIYVVASLSRWTQIPLLNNLFMVGSFGASAVLIYGAPLAEFSQPRNLVGGHVLSALVGVSITRYLPLDPSLLAALAVSVSIVIMLWTRTLHPPGGATALIAVVGGPEVQNLGYTYALSPIAVGALIMLLVALVVNNLSDHPERHYPRYWI